VNSNTLSRHNTAHSLFHAQDKHIQNFDQGLYLAEIGDDIHVQCDFCTGKPIQWLID
jgi:hypothetical protein